jgi:uncharacterized membrane protein YfcA
MMDVALILAAAFVAGLMDAVVGGGGLIQIPLLFSALPTASPGTIFGTNKLAAVFGTASAAWRFVRRVEVPWGVAMPAGIVAFLASFLGAMTVSVLPAQLLRPLVLVLLILVAFYTYSRKDFGRTDRGLVLRRRHAVIAALLGGAIGFYDGFFGPGTGSFLIFLFIRCFGLDFLRASAAAKIVNVMTNLAALLYFGPRGQMIVSLGLGMAVFNVAGSQLGAHLAVRHGSVFVRKLFLIVVSVLIVKFAWNLVGQQ